MQNTHETYMRRCIELALLGAATVAPNPMVGAVLVHNNRIIGEGWHQQFGAPHAEVNCINSVVETDIPLIPGSTLYVSLEPCTHFGKTPPCSDLIIQKKISKVIIGCRDHFAEVNGKGVEKLKTAGVEVISGVWEEACKELNKRFFTFHTKQRPYTNHLVHQWRSEEAAILVGTNTALLDDPSLTNRLWTGKSPVRMVLDMVLRLPETLKLFDQQQKTIVFNGLKQEENENVLYSQINPDNDINQQILDVSYKLKLQSILVEGGTKLLQSFIAKGLWDEARIISNEELVISNGLAAPLLNNHPVKTEKIYSDTIRYYTNKPSPH